MKTTNIFSSCILALSLISLNGCVSNQILDGKAERLSEKYQPINNFSAYMNTNKDLQICVDVLKEGSTKAETVSQHIPWQSFRIKSFSMLIHKGHGNYLLDAREYVTGCEVKADYTPIPITMVDVDQEISDYSTYYQYIANLPRRNAEYTLYLLNSNKFKTITTKCGKKDCHYDLAYSWPRLLIKATPKNRPPEVRISLLAGHSGEKRGYSAGEKAKAMAIDTVTFPFQLIFGVLYPVLGSH